MNVKTKMKTKMKRVVIDGRMVTPVPHGFARYVARLADALRILTGQGEGLAYHPVFLVDEKTDRRAFNGFETALVKSPFLSPGELLEIPLVLRQLRADAYHSPTFSSLLSSPCPWLVTVHDLNHLIYGGPKEKLYYRWVLRRFARNAARLLTVSEFSRNELADWLSIPPERIQVVPNALGAELFEKPSASRIEEIAARHGLRPGAYYFCLSNPKPHKNVPFLIEAYRKARNTRGDLWPLVLSLRGLADPTAPGIVELGGLEDEEVHALMHGAGALVFPSRYEGFGLPPVEAISIGVPVIASDIAPHREGLRDVPPEEVVWAKPDDLDAWVHALISPPKRPSADTMDRIRNRYSIAKLGVLMDRLYRDVLGV